MTSSVGRDPAGSRAFQTVCQRSTDAHRRLNRGRLGVITGTAEPTNDPDINGIAVLSSPRGRQPEFLRPSQIGKRKILNAAGIAISSIECGDDEAAGRDAIARIRRHGGRSAPMILAASFDGPG